MGEKIATRAAYGKSLVELAEKYPDLVVRVTGYSAFFNTLTKDYRQQVIDRFLSRKK